MKEVDSDWLVFLMSVGVFTLYLVFSAMTEMGTKIPNFRSRKTTQFKVKEADKESKTD